MTLPVFLLGVFFRLMERRLEDYVLEKVSFEKKVPRFFECLTPGQFVAALLAADGMGQTEIAEVLAVRSQTIQKRIRVARDKAAQVFGEEALAGRSNPRDRYRKNECQE